MTETCGATVPEPGLSLGHRCGRKAKFKVTFPATRYTSQRIRFFCGQHVRTWLHPWRMCTVEPWVEESFKEAP
jgi:hypothetical protein